MDKEKFYTQLSEKLFYAVAEVFPDEEKIYVCNIRKNLEYTLTKSQAEALFADQVFACAGSGKPDFKECSRLLKDKISKKSYGLSIETKPHILERFVLSLYPVFDENKLLATLSCSENSDKTVTFLSKKSIVNYNISDILYISYGNHCVQIHCNHGSDNLFYIAFPDAADALLKHSNFLRSYKNCIVNLDKVDCIENDSFVMCNRDIISIPKRRLKEIKHAYAEYKLFKNEF